MARKELIDGQARAVHVHVPDVMLHGAYTARAALRAGVLDVLEIQLIPVLFGQGRRLFDGLGPEHTELRLVRTLESPGALLLRYQVQHG